MRRVVIATGLVTALLAAGLLPAAASTVGLRSLIAPVLGQEDGQGDGGQDGGQEEPTKDTAKVEPLKLDCVAIDHGDQQREYRGVGCQWSEARHPAFTAYRLLRAERGGDRVVVHTTADQAATRHFDDTADPAGTYQYVVESTDADGNVIGRSRPATPRSMAARGAAEAEEGSATDGASGNGAEDSAPSPEDKPGADRPRPHTKPQPSDRDPAAYGHRPDGKVEPLDLHCLAIDHEEYQGVGCQWSEARHPAFAAYRLSRTERPAGSEATEHATEPTVVFTTPDRTETRHFDGTADPAGHWAYVIEALDAEGHVISASRPVPARSHHGRPAPDGGGDQPVLPSGAGRLGAGALS